MDELRRLPKVDALAQSAELAGFPEATRIEASRATVDKLRQLIRSGEPQPEPAAAMAARLAQELSEPRLRPTLNLSGVILHTGLGRARLAAAAAQQLNSIASSHAALELDLETGRRGDRQEHVRDLLKRLTGAEDALVVNNAAAGVLLTLTSLCGGRQVILSRGQMVEIGGSFRMPDIVRQSGCQLVEVGCTNKTRLSDYESALTDQTAALLRCHPSNFKIVGFTEEPSLKDLSDLARRSGVLLVDDQGSGSLLDLSEFGLGEQPQLRESVALSSVSIASCDKLLGGPQAGLILGSGTHIRRIKDHPLARCVRVDKLTLAALEATLRLYIEHRTSEIPTLRYLTRSPTEIEIVAKRLALAFKHQSLVQESRTEIGGGSAPGAELKTFRVGIKSGNPEELAKKLRAGRPSIIGRIEDGWLWLDPRTLDDDEVGLVERALSSL